MSDKRKKERRVPTPRRRARVLPKDRRRAERRRARIDRLLKRLGVCVHEHCGYRDCTTWRTYREATAAVERLLAQEGRA